MSIKLKGSTDGSVSLDAPADTSPTGTDVSLTLPTSAGSANQFLKNGSTAGTLEYSSMVEDDSQHVILGSSTVPTIQENQFRFTVSGEGFDNSSSCFVRYGTSSFGPALILAKARGTESSPVIVDQNDKCGQIRFVGHDGTDMENALAEIYGEIDGTPGDNDLPGRLIFATTADGASTTSERIRVDNSGQVFINTTSNPTNNATGIINAVSTTTGDMINLKHVKNGNNAINIWQTGTSNYSPLVFYKGNTQTSVGSVRCTTTSTSFNTSSDYRLKENVVDIADGITRVKQLQPKRFNFIIEPNKTVDGFLAHEAQAVVPEAVTGTHNEVDDDGNAVMQGIDQSKLVPLLTAALQEAIAKIETLETKVAALEAAS